MTDILSFQQLYDKLEELNTSAYHFLAKDDFEGFHNAVNSFMESGIMEQKRFPSARAAYRYSSMPFTINHIWPGAEAENRLSDYIFFHISQGLTIQDLKQRDVLPVYAYMARRLGPDPLALTEEEKEQERQERLENKLVEKRCAAFHDFIEKYKHLYDPVDNRINFLSVPLVSNVSKHQMVYIQRVADLAKARSRFHLTYNFNCTTVNGNDLENKTIPDKIKLLTDKLPDLYHNGKMNPDLEKYLTFDSRDEKILASNYLQGKHVPRKNWKNYCKGIMPNYHFFYLELAFYLNIPSSDEVEKFMNLHGYSIKGPMTHFQDISNSHILHRDLCRWIDAGIDYNLINDMCGFKLEEKEVRKPKSV